MTLRVRAKPNSREASLEEGPDGVWIARLKSPPVDGKANAELVRLVAARFKVPRCRVSIAGGAGARLKLVRIAP